MERFFAKHHVKPRIIMEIRSTETIKQAVMAGMGLSFLSLRTARQEIASGHLTPLDIDGLPLIRHWFITRLKAKRLPPVAAEFERFRWRKVKRWSMPGHELPRTALMNRSGRHDRIARFAICCSQRANKVVVDVIVPRC